MVSGGVRIIAIAIGAQVENFIGRRSAESPSVRNTKAVDRVCPELITPRLICEFPATSCRVPSELSGPERLSAPVRVIVLMAGRKVTGGLLWRPVAIPVVTPADGATTQYGHDDPIAVAWWQNATLENQPYLNPNPTLDPRPHATYPRLWTDDVSEDVRTCLRLASQHGMDVLMLDQTRPDIGLSVVKVIVPAMRVFWRRLGPGRLYDVPAALGWLDAPLDEQQMNPIPFFL